MSGAILSFKQLLTDLIIGSVSLWSTGLGIMADIIILMEGLTFLTEAIKLP